MYRWLVVLLLGSLLLPSGSVAAQEFYESPYVILVQATKCIYNPDTSNVAAGQATARQTTRYQTGFRVKGQPGIFTALHGLADCDSIYTLSDDYQRLELFEVDVDHDVVRLCAAKDLRTKNAQPEQLECVSDSLEEGFTPAVATNTNLTGLKIIGHPAGSPGQYTIESTKTTKTSTDTLASLVGPALAGKLELRQSPLPTIRVIALEGALAAGLSGAPVLNSDGQLIGIGDGSQAEGLSWLIPWPVQPISKAAAQTHLDRLRNLNPTDFFLSATANQTVNTGFVIYRGTVRIQGQERSIKDAQVVVQLIDQTHRVYTKTDGEFLIVLRTSTANQEQLGTIRVEKEGYVTYEANVEDLFQQGQPQDIRLDPITPPRPTTFRKGMYVRVSALKGANYYQSSTADTPIGLFAPNVVLALVDGPEQSRAVTWWKVRRLEEKVENAVWMPVADGQTIYVEAIDKLGRNDCVFTKDRLAFQEKAEFDAGFVMVEPNTLLRVLDSHLTEKDDALWVQVERINSVGGQGWVEYVGTGGVNLQIKDGCEPAMLPTPAATSKPSPSPLLQPTATIASIIAPSYPCEATIVSTTGANPLYIIRRTPRGTSLDTPVYIGEKFTVVEIHENEPLYHIFSNGIERGWLPVKFTDSSSCPKIRGIAD